MLNLLGKIWDRAMPGAGKNAAARLASPPARVRGFLEELGARRVLVHADRTGFEAAAAALAGIDCTWASNALAEIETGAAHPEDVDWRGFDATVAAGLDLPSRYRQLLRLAARTGGTRPALWLGEGFAVGAGAFSVPADVTDVEALLFNHFDAFFGIKDPLQFRIEIRHGADTRRIWRVLPPNQSTVIRLSEHFPARRHAASLAAFVEHPILAHDPVRLCADVFWKRSLTTLHGTGPHGAPSHGPDQAAEFLLPAWLIREGEAVLTLPDPGRGTEAADALETVVTGKVETVQHEPSHHVTQSAIRRDGTEDDQVLGWRRRDFGGANWFVLESAGALADCHDASIAGGSVTGRPNSGHDDFAAGPEDLARYQRLERDGFVLEPYPVPLSSPGDELAFAFVADAVDPRPGDYRLDYFDARGRHLGTLRHANRAPGPLFPQELAEQAGADVKAQAKLALISVDWLKAKLRSKDFRPTAHLLVRNRRTGDQDLTEIRSCWRNLGMAVPGFPHPQSDELAIIGRTNLLGRVRCDRGLRTGAILINGSGRLGYRMSAQVTLAALNQAGLQISTELTVPAFGWRLVWLDEAMPLLPVHLGGAAGALLVRSPDAELNCQIVTTTPDGAVSLQHL